MTQAPRAPALLHRHRRRARARAAAVRRGRHAADLLGRRRPERRARGGQRHARLRAPRAGHEVDRARAARARRSSASSASRARTGFRYVSCPEFLKEGSAVRDFLEPDRVVVGDDGDWAGDAVVELYAPLGAPLVRTDIASAEMIKLAANAFLATKISFINEIANVCEVTGANVIEVAKGIGLDDRIGPKFLQAGVGFGGSCLARGRDRAHPSPRAHDPHAPRGPVAPAGERGRARRRRRHRARRPGDPLVGARPGRAAVPAGDVRHPARLRGRAGRGAHQDGPAGALHAGPPVAGRRRRAAARSRSSSPRTSTHRGLAAARDGAHARSGVQPGSRRCSPLPRPPRSRRTAHRAPAPGAGRCARRRRARRTHEIKRTGTMRLHEMAAAELPLRGSTMRTAKNGTEVASELSLDAASGGWWGSTSPRATRRPSGCTGAFIPTREQHLVDEVAAYWLRTALAYATVRLATTHEVRVQSRLASAWWTQVLGLGRTSYEQRLPDLIWDRPPADKWALLSGLFEGDGSWSLDQRRAERASSSSARSATSSPTACCGCSARSASSRRGASVVSRSRRRTRTGCASAAPSRSSARSALVPERDRPGVLASVARRPSASPRPARGASTTARRGSVSTSTERQPFAGPVYSFEVVGTHSVRHDAAGWTTHNCFPKDVTALKQLAGNSGYHFQLLNAVIEVNELQKRRVIAKLEKHLGTLVGKKRGAARAGVQAQHRRHARGDVAGAQRAAAGRRARRSAPTTRSPRTRRAS